MNRVQKDLKVLRSMKHDIETRLKGQIKESLAGKLQKFIVNIQVLEQSIDSCRLRDAEYLAVLKELDALKSASNSFQQKVNNVSRVKLFTLQNARSQCQPMPSR